MAITDILNLKDWFKKGKKPTQEQFHAIFDSFWHKSEKVPTDNIDGLQEALGKKQDKLIAGETIRDLEVDHQTMSLLGSGALSINAGTYHSFGHNFTRDEPELEASLIAKDTVRGELESLRGGYTHFGQSRLLQMTIRFRFLEDIQGFVFSREPFGSQITNDFGNSAYTPGNVGVVIARVTNGRETELVEVEDTFMPGGYNGFRVITHSNISGGECSLTVFMYGTPV